MKHKALKVGLTSLVLALSFGGLMYTTMAESTEYYKHVEEVMGAARPLVRQAAAAARLRQARLDLQEAQLDGVSLRGPEPGPRGAGHLHRHRARHLQGRRRGGAEGRARARRLQGAPQRRDGEVPVEVRSQGRRRRGGGRHGRFRRTAPTSRAAPGAAPRPAGDRQRDPDGHTRCVPAPARLRDLGLRGGRLGGRRPAAQRPAHRQRRRRALSGGRGDDGGLRRHRPRLRRRRLHHPLRPALLRIGAAARLQDRLGTGAGSTAR